jgi:hypothetical protein
MLDQGRDDGLAASGGAAKERKLNIAQQLARYRFAAQIRVRKRRQI